MTVSKSIYKVIFSLLCLVAIPFEGFAESKETSQKEKLVVGTTSAYAPYVSLNEKGEYEGFDVDLAHLIAERMDKQLVLKDLGGMTSLLMALQKKKIDAIIWAMSITESRQKEMNMIYYQGEKTTEMPFIFWKEIPKGIEKIEDLEKISGATICVEAGSYQDSVLQKYPSLKTRFLDKVTDAIMEVKYGKALTATIDNSLVPRVGTQYPELKILNLPLPYSQQSLGYGVCIHKENQKLTDQVDKIIADLRSEGKIAELEKKWKIVK